MERRKLDPMPLTRQHRKANPAGLVVWGEIFTIAVFLAGIVLYATDKMGIHIY